MHKKQCMRAAFLFQNGFLQSAFTAAAKARRFPACCSLHHRQAAARQKSRRPRTASRSGMPCTASSQTWLCMTRPSNVDPAFCRTGAYLIISVAAARCTIKRRTPAENLHSAGYGITARGAHHRQAVLSTDAEYRSFFKRHFFPSYHRPWTHCARIKPSAANAVFVFSPLLPVFYGNIHIKKYRPQKFPCAASLKCRMLFGIFSHTHRRSARVVSPLAFTQAACRIRALFFRCPPA